MFNLMVNNSNEAFANLSYFASGFAKAGAKLRQISELTNFSPLFLLMIFIGDLDLATMIG